MGFLRQRWYLAAWADELAVEGRLSRTLLNEPLLIWRANDGTLSALADRCPHRSAPLSLGHCNGVSIRCGYHGLRFDPSGACIENPHGAITSALAVPSFPMVERHHGLWIWMGDRDDADPALIPDLWFVDAATEHSWSKGYMHTAAGHKLLEDNILDLSHADYLHPDTLGGGALTRTKARIDEQSQTIFVEWLATNERPMPVFAQLMPDPEALADIWTSVQWHPNGVMILRAGATPTGMPRESGLDSWNAHVMTPETATTTHYFYCNCRQYLTDDAVFNAAIAASLRAAFETEDKPMIEAQQRRLGDRELFDLKPALLPIDAASTRVRRIFDRLLAAERLSS